MIEDGEEREAERETREEWGTRGRGYGMGLVLIRACFFILKILGFSLASISLLPTSAPPQPSPASTSPFPSSVYWELARSRILRS